jgi:integrase
MDFGAELMRQAESEETLTAIARAETYRDGLMIAFLAARPLRLKNMLGLEIGTDFIEANGSYEVDLLEEATKTKVGIEFPVPPRLVSDMRRYLTHHRKILLAGPDGVVGGYLDQANYLWLARSGRQFPVASFEDMIARRTTERFGVRLTPHRFRNCAATSIAENNPEEFHIIRIILGHSTIATAEQHYIQAKNREAVRMVQDNLITMRNPTARRPPAETTRPLYAADTLLFAGHSETYKRGFTR